MDQPEASPALDSNVKVPGVMAPPHEPAAARQDGASDEVLASMWPSKAANGLTQLQAGYNGGLDKAEVLPNGTPQAERPAEGSVPDVGSLDAAPGPTTAQVAPLGQPAAPANGSVEALPQPGPANGPGRADLTPTQLQAIAELEHILARISQLDQEGWFQVPITDQMAPNYHSIIKQPMCFQVRRGLVRDHLLWLRSAYTARSAPLAPLAHPFQN